MQGNSRRVSFILNAAVMAVIFIIICLNTNGSLYYTPGPFKSWTEYLPFLALNLSAFLCSLLLQAEEILTIYRKKEPLLIRRELIVLSGVCFLIGLEKYICLLLIPANRLAAVHSGLAMMTAGVFLADNIDIVFMFAAGILLVRAFYFQEAPIGRKQRKNYFLLYVSLMLLIVLTSYFKIWFFMNIDEFIKSIYLVNISIVFYTLIYALILQAERIVPAARRRKMQQVRWEMAVLGIISLSFAIAEIWMAAHLYESDSPVIQSIIGSDLWQISYAFAAGMFFVRAFTAKPCRNDAPDRCEPN